MNETRTQDNAPPAGGTASLPSAEERKLATFAHLSALIGALLTSGWGGSIGFFVGPRARRR